MERLYFIDFRNNWETGIEKKITKQCEIFNAIFGFCKRITLENNKPSNFTKIEMVIPFMSPYLYKKLKDIASNSYCYIRYNKIDYRGIRALKKLHEKRCVIFVEIPTYPYDNELNIKTKILYYKDFISRNLLHKYVDRIVTYSDDDYIFKTKTICISNAVDLDNINVSVKSKNTSSIVLIAVATLQFWHGYDRMIKSIYDYKKNGGKRLMTFHIVGDGDQLLKYEELIKEYHLEGVVVLHGRKTGTELDVLYNEADIAIDSLGRHRSGVFYNSSLKGKEYLAKGLPIVSGVKTELDDEAEFKYYCRVPADDSIFDFEKIIDFYDVVYSSADRENIRQEVRSFCEKKFSYKVCYQKIVDCYKQYER